MEYGAIIWDPYNKNYINKLENLQMLQTRRQHQRLIFFYKVVEGQIAAIPPPEYNI
jgi:hypothetical protein